MAADAEDDNDVLRFLNDDLLDNSQFMSSIFPDQESAGLLPANVTTSNVESTSNPSQPHQGVVAEEVVFITHFCCTLKIKSHI